MRYGAVIAAVHSLSRLKQIRRVTDCSDEEMAKRIADSFMRAGVEEIMLVTDDDSDRFERQLKRRGIAFMHIDAPADMFTAVKEGLTCLRERCGRVFVCPVDIPFFSWETLTGMMRLYGDIVVPGNHDRAGHPVLINTAVLLEVLRYNGNNGLNGALASSSFEKVYYTVEDKGIFLDTDQPVAVRETLVQHQKKRIHPSVKVRLAGETPFFGPGMATLLRMIVYAGSVREGCQYMGISYSKGREMLRTAESELGYLLVYRQQGGKNGGAAALTPQGERLLSRYEQYRRLVQIYAEETYAQIFVPWSEDGTDLSDKK